MSEPLSTSQPAAAAARAVSASLQRPGLAQDRGVYPKSLWNHRAASRILSRCSPNDEGSAPIHGYRPAPILAWDFQPFSGAAAAAVS